MRVTHDYLLSKGFKENLRKSSRKATIYTKERFDVAIKSDGSAYYTNGGFDYSLESTEALERLFRALRRR